MITKPIGLYVHIPFCKQKCSYCDFVSFGGALSRFEEEYTEALVKEILEYKTEEKIKVDTVFFGGGTPSIISGKSFEKITNSLRESFDILPLTEFTLEANPKTVTKEKLSVYTDLGVNRISLGLQSIHENELKILGRIHNFDEFLESYDLCKSAGVTNLNVDLMYGLPSQTVESFSETLDKVASLSPSHISAYGLILEKGTRLYENRESLVFPSEDEECEMYYTAAKKLKSLGYSHYEISNYAKDGRECRHNLKYWRDEEYIGLGLAAHSYFGKKRYANPGVFDEYFANGRKEYVQTEEIDREANAYEYAMMRLRLSEGFSLSDYEKRFGVSFLSEREELIDRLVKGGYATLLNGRFSLTEEGFYVSNSILSELL